MAWERGNSAKGRCLGVSRGICPGAFRTPSHPSSHRMSLCLQGPQSRFQTGKRDVREPDPQAPAQPLWKSEIWWLRCGQTGCCNCFVSAGPIRAVTRHTRTVCLFPLKEADFTFSLLFRSSSHLNLLIRYSPSPSPSTSSDNCLLATSCLRNCARNTFWFLTRLLNFSAGNGSEQFPGQNVGDRASYSSPASRPRSFRDVSSFFLRRALAEYSLYQLIYRSANATQ